MTTDTQSGNDTSHNLKCATCGTYISLIGQIVRCSKCRTQLPLQAAILTIMAQADEDGRLVDIQSIRAGLSGRLTFDFLAEETKKRGQSKADAAQILPRIVKRKNSA